LYFIPVPPENIFINGKCLACGCAAIVEGWDLEPVSSMDQEARLDFELELELGLDNHIMAVLDRL